MESLTLRPVAVYHCDFPMKFGLPRQSGLAPAICGTVAFLPPFQNPDCLRGIEQFSHLWLLWQFSCSEPNDSLTVRPPKLGGNTRMGVFATRAPFRPNPIGLSCVKLEQVTQSPQGAPLLVVSGADLVSGTPIFDIKPYLPYADAHPEAQSGFAVEDASLSVEVPTALLDCIPAEKREALLQTLRLDPRPGYQSDPERVYYLRYGAFDVGFRVKNGVLQVVEVRAENEENG